MWLYLRCNWWVSRGAVLMRLHVILWSLYTVLMVSFGVSLVQCCEENRRQLAGCFLVLSVHKSVSSWSEEVAVAHVDPSACTGIAGLAAGKAGQSGWLPAESVGSALKVT